MTEKPQGPDALILLRQSIAANTPPVPTTSSTPGSASSVEQNLAHATHLQFNYDGHQVLPLSYSTRFESSGKPVDLRSVFFAWLNKDQPTASYINETQRLNDELGQPGGAGGSVQNLVFAEKLDLITWLDGASDDSEHIKPLAAEAQAEQADEAADLAAGEKGTAAATKDGALLGTKDQRAVDSRLKEIYKAERKMGNRNTVLRGIKPTVRDIASHKRPWTNSAQDFSHVRKLTGAFLNRTRGKGRPTPPAVSSTSTNGVATPATPNPGSATPGKAAKERSRTEPIILLSPSASSLLRMSNIKSFLENGVYEPPDSTFSGANMLRISRLLPSISPHRPQRFILVDSTDNFKPDYWSNIAAVFTTGQQWQFKSYKWQSPPDLFSHALGVYVGWRGEDIPSTVRSWGRGVMTAQIDKYHPNQGLQARWRDREVVERIWTAIEESLKSKGMRQNAGR